MRHFEQVVLVSEDGTQTIIERRYNTGEVEYWAVMTITFRNGQHEGQAQVPFRIETPDAYDIPGGDLMEDDEFKAAMRAAEREAAFANFDAAMEAAKPAAHASVKEKVEQQVRQHNSKVLLAAALPHIPVRRRINGGE